MASRGSNKNKYNYITDTTIHNDFGDEIHILDGPNGILEIKNLDASASLYSGVEYCPNCHRLMRHVIDYWECDICNHSITDDESRDGEGYPSLQSTYESDYSSYDDDDDEDEDYEDYYDD